MNKIGVKNFRVFKEFTEFEIKPITLLTGPNNAGKSSFTKLLLLLKNGIIKLDFEKGLHNLENFEKVLNWETKNDTLTLTFQNNVPFLSDEFSVELNYKKNKIEEITFGNKHIKLLNYKIVEYDQDYLIDRYGNTDYSMLKNGYEAKEKFIFNLDINSLIELIYNKEIADKIAFVEKKRFDIDFTISNIREVTKNKIKNLNIPDDKKNKLFFKDIDTEQNFNELSNLDNDFSLYADPDSFINQRAIAIFNEIDHLEKNYILYEIILNGKKHQIESEEMIMIQKQIFSNIEVYSNGNKINYCIIDELKNTFKYINNIAKRDIKHFYREKMKTENIEIKDTALGNFIFNEKLYDFDFGVTFEDYSTLSGDEYIINGFQSTFFNQFQKYFDSLANDFKNIDFISGNRGQQKRVLANKSDNEIDELVLKHYNNLNENKINNKKIEFLKNCLNLLDIKGSIEIERFENVISVVYIVTEERKVALSDLGFGYSQIIPIILKIINMEEDYSTLIIEEPEANLHPNLQSKLANIFGYALYSFPYLKLIIETHSEYFIRGLQNLTAKKIISTEDSVIYYFNSDKYVSPHEPKVKQIEIRVNGNLSDTFGPGFYDETTRLQFDLMKLNQEQNN